MKNLEYNLKTIIKYGIYLVLFTPLIYTSFTLYPFIFSKTLFFRGLVEIIFALFLILMVIFPKYKPKKSLISTSILVYLCVLILSTLFSVDSARSFWSNHERMMGFLTTFHAMLLFVVAMSVFRTKEEWKTLFGVSVWVSLIVGFLGIYQYFSESFLHITGGGRVYSTLGNFIYFGAYGLFHAVISLIFFIKEKKKKSFTGIFWFSGFLIGLISIYLSGSRGVFLSACGALFLIILLHALFYPKKKTKIVFGIIFVVIVVSGLGLWFAKDTLLVQGNKITRGLSDISLEAATGKTRLINWGVAYEAWKEKPILGWGIDNYYISFNKHFNPEIYRYGAYETWQDHAHNIVFDTLNESGVLGLLAYLFIFFAAFYSIYWGVKNKKIDFTTGVLFASLLCAYFAENLLVFDTLTSLMLFYLILGYIHSADIYGEKVSDKSIEIKKMSPEYRYAFIGFVLLSLVLLLYFTVITQFRGSFMTIKALKNFQYDFTSSVEDLKKAADLSSPYLQETRDETSKIILMAVQAGINLPEDQMKNYLSWAERELEKNVEEHPLDFYHWNYLGQWYFTMAQVTGDTSYFYKAEDAINKAIDLSPKRQQGYFTKARLYFVKQEYDKAIETLQVAVDLDPEVIDSHWNLGIAYAYAERIDEAYEHFEFAHEKLKQVTNKAELSLALKVYGEKDDESGVDWLANELIKNIANPGPLEYAKLANAYRKVGNLEKVMFYREEALKLAPGTEEQLDEIIRGN